jgi:polyphosphate kinase
VTALTELRARFDEEGNIAWSKVLERAGVHVIYGPSDYKVHSKLLRITRKMRGKIETFVQVGTGNYNEKTAAIYTDYCLMTADPVLGEEAGKVFEALRNNEIPKPMEYLLAAPLGLRPRVIEHIHEEIAFAKAGKPAYIGLKMNGLCDKTIIQKLIEASQAGVKIELLIRGICCLLPNVPELTENIEIRSIVGRYLEHSRVYLFGTEERRAVYIGSADFMPRNTKKRVEICAPIRDAAIRRRICEEFSLQFNDPVKARIRLADGSYVRPQPKDDVLPSQEQLYHAAYQRIQNTEAPQLLSHHD